MFKTYFKTAIRSLTRHKSNSIINILGLIVGFAAFLLIFLVVRYENSFDDFHANKDKIYRVVRIGRNPENREYRPGVPFPVTAGLRSSIPQLKKVAAIYGDNDVQISVIDEKGSPTTKFKEPHVMVAEPEFFQMFNFPLAAGNLNSALGEVNSVLLTKETAKKYFGDWHSAIGKSIKLYGEPMKVTGILENPPVNTDFPLSVVVSYATLNHRLNPNDWASISDFNYCFIQLAQTETPAQLKKMIDDFTDKNIKPVNSGYTLELEPLEEIHHDSRYGDFNGTFFSNDLSFGLSIIGVFLLIIACVNFINISTAQAVNRAREVGVRKVLGSERSQIIVQFLGETGITTFLALSASIFIAIISLQFVNNLLDINLTIPDLFGMGFGIFMLAAFVLVTLLAGFYPALVLSGFKSIRVLKSSFSSDQKGIFLRRGLVVFQFVIAQALIIGTLIVASQMDYFRNADMGFRKDAIINAGFPGDSLSKTKMDFLYNELVKLNGVQQVSFSTFEPSAGGGWYTDLRTEEDLHSKEPKEIVSMKPADTSFFSLYNLPLVAGRLYFPSDTIREFILNETAVHGMSIQDPAKAIGKIVNVNGTTGPIVGVVKDFHINSLRDPIGPVVMTSFKRAYGLANIKIDMRNAKAITASIQDTWNKYFPDYIFEYKFLDQSIANYYKQENQLSILYVIFSVIAIFISCLVLYGLITFMAARKKKEIGIRKVLGAPVRDIVIMLSKEFTILILVAFVIAAPIGWYFMHQWLQQYTYRIKVGPRFFILTIICSLVIAWLTISYNAMKAALANPVKSLRTE